MHRITSSAGLRRKSAVCSQSAFKSAFPARTALTAAGCLAFLLLLLFDPAPALEGARRGLSLCGETVIPSLFPFLVLSGFIIQFGLAERLGRWMETATRLLFRLPGCAGTALILGAVGGYPVGAGAVGELRRRGLLSEAEAERLLCFCINSSPAFIIGAVGSGMLHSTAAGILLCAAHLGASFAVGLTLRFGARRLPAENSRPARRPPEEPHGVAETFVVSVTGSIRSVLSIAAFVVLFSSLNALLNDLGVPALLAGLAAHVAPPPSGDPLFYRRAVSGILEVTNGCAAASGGGGMEALLLLSLMLGWAGVSVQFQVVSMVRGSHVSARPFFFTRFLHMFFSALLTFALFLLFPGAVPSAAPTAQVFAWNGSAVSSAFHPAPAVCAMLLVCAILLLSLAQV